MLLVVLFASLCARATTVDSVQDRGQQKMVYNHEFGEVNSTHYTLAYRQVTREQWQQADVKEDAESLTAFGEVVMARDEGPYMRELAKVVTSSRGSAGSILEVGFGMAISASFIQDEGCKRHVIIEANKAIMGKCLDWVQKNKNKSSTVIPMFGFWENVTGVLQSESFDGTVFDPFPSTVTVPFMREARRLLRTGGVLTYYLQHWKGAGDKMEVWNRSQRMLYKAGWTKSEIMEPKFMELSIRSDCGKYPDCPMEKIVMIVPTVIKGGTSSKIGVMRGEPLYREPGIPAQEL